MPRAYELIAEDLRRRMQEGALRPGDRLPSETEMRDAYGRSLPTVRQALSQLLSEGVIVRQPGAGVFVRVPRRRVARDVSRHQTEKGIAAAYRGGAAAGAWPDKEYTVVAHYQPVEADPLLADAFGVRSGTALLERDYRVSYSDEYTPFEMAQSYLLMEHAQRCADLMNPGNEPWPGGVHHQLLRAGVEVDRVTESLLSARAPSRDEAQVLGLGAGTAVLLMRRVCWDVSGRVVEVCDSVLAGDRTRVSSVVLLDRWPAPATA